MTEGHESDFLVTVRAQVMTRDESTEGWLPLAGGGLANVSIRKRARLSPGATGHEYIIYGQRTTDQSVILSCVINRDLKYFKVMPTFHHWRAGKQRNGLTFQTAADARAFDKGVVRAYNELIDGLVKSNPTIVPSPLTKYDSVGEDDVFMTLELPIETTDTTTLQQQSPSPDASVKSETENNCDRSENQTSSIHYISCEKPNMKPPSLGTPVTTISSRVVGIDQKSAMPLTKDNYSYVTLNALHDYNYPVVDQPPIAQVLNVRRESITSLKKRNALEAAAQVLAAASHQSSAIAANSDIMDILKNPTTAEDIKKSQQHTLTRCRYCNELYNDDWNRRGACEFAPDCFRTGFECISGMGCARCMLYHCMSDAEGEMPTHPCTCTATESSGCTRRWIGLTLLSLLVPCLWCYPPLRACHWIGVACGICGGKHKPQV